jgi:PAS domain S-box-containing protein
MAGSLSIIFVILATDFFLLLPLYSIDFLVADIPGIVIFVVVIVSINSLKRSVEARHRLEAIVEASEDAIVGITLDGSISSWNKGAETIYGYSAQEVMGKSISNILLLGQIAKAASVLEQIKQGEPVSPFEMAHTNRNGRLIDLSIKLVPLKNVIGEVVGATIRVSDITKRKRTQEWLNIRYIAIENIADIVFIADRPGIICQGSPHREHLELSTA